MTLGKGKMAILLKTQLSAVAIQTIANVLEEIYPSFLLRYDCHLRYDWFLLRYDCHRTLR